MTASGKRPERIVSGGQTGADRGGLDAAIELGIPHGGWCPKGRHAEDGPIPDRYLLRETPSSDYPQRTQRNVTDSDATVVFTVGFARGGSALTLDLAQEYGRPSLHLDLSELDEAQAALRLRAWFQEIGVAVLNVAGSRESVIPGLQGRVRRILVDAFGPAADPNFKG